MHGLDLAAGFFQALTHLFGHHHAAVLAFDAGAREDCRLMPRVAWWSPTLAATTQLRPSALAWYRALSAAAIRSFRAIPCVG